MIKVGIIGGSGLDDPQLLKSVKERHITTPYGNPSSALTVGSIEGREVVIISRHGKQHTIPPTHVNYRANIHALQSQGCTHILATTACGSLPARRTPSIPRCPIPSTSRCGRSSSLALRRWD